MELRIPLTSFLDAGDQDLLAYYVDDYGRKWSSLKIDVTVAPQNVDEVPLEAKTFTLKLSYYYEGNSDKVSPAVPECTPSGPTLHAINQTRMPGTYFIALKEEMAEQVWQTCSAILDYTYFHTAGYIPVYMTSQSACEALDEHCGKRISRRKVFKITLAPGGNLYCRPDKFDKWKHKLFFPIPLASGDHTDELIKRWEWYKLEYKSQAQHPNRWTWEWEAANFTCLAVGEVKIF